MDPNDNKSAELDALKAFTENTDITEDVEVAESQDLSKQYVSNAPSHGYERLDKAIMPNGGRHYPANMEFDVRPANTAEIRHWSSIDDTSHPQRIYDYFNDIVEKCVIVHNGSWDSIKETDRIWFVFKIHQLSFTEAERPIVLNCKCPACNKKYKSKIDVNIIQYTEPSIDVDKYLNADTGALDIKFKNGDEITITTPSLKTAKASLAYMSNKDAEWLQSNKQFLELAPYLIEPGITPTEKVFNNLFVKWSSWNSQKLSNMIDLINRCKMKVNPRMMTKCPSCNNESSQDFDLEGGIKSLFLPVSNLDSELL